MGIVMPFVAHRVMEYPAAAIMYGGQEIVPTLFTNSLRCEDCGFIFSQVRYSDDQMARLYKGYRGPEYNEMRSVYEPAYAEFAARVGTDEIEIQARQIAMRRFLDGSLDYDAIESLLDYGGDHGQHIPAFIPAKKKYVYEVSGVEVLPGIELVRDLDRMAPVDLVINANVLEHLPYPRQALERIRPLCHRNSRLFVDVPFELKSEDHYPGGFHEHINFFSLKSLQALLSTCGFEVLKIEMIECDYEWQKVRSVYALARPAWFG